MNLDVFYFVLSMFLGFFVVYMITPVPKLVIKYPNIKNPDDTLYMDDNNVCYRYKKEKVDCENFQ